MTKQLCECSGGDDTVQMKDGAQTVKMKCPSANKFAQVQHAKLLNVVLIIALSTAFGMVQFCRGQQSTLQSSLEDCFHCSSSINVSLSVPLGLCYTSFRNCHVFNTQSLQMMSI